MCYISFTVAIYYVQEPHFILHLTYELASLPAKVLMVGFTLNIILPRYLLTKQFGKAILSIILSLLFSVWLLYLLVTNTVYPVYYPEVKDGREHMRVQESDIGFLQGDRNYCRLHLPDKTVTLSGNLAYYSSRLSPKRFRRIHRSYLIAHGHIERFNAESVWIYGKEIPIGPTYKRSLMNYLDEHRL